MDTKEEQYYADAFIEALCKIYNIPDHERTAIIEAKGFDKNNLSDNKMLQNTCTKDYRVEDFADEKRIGTDREH